MENLISKKCSKCNTTFPLTEEYFEYRSDGYVRGQCRECVSERRKKYLRKPKNRKRNIEYQKVYRYTDLAKYKDRMRRSYSTYKIDEEGIRDLMDSQRGCCAICGNSIEDYEIDHSHETGEVRGLLCRHCNLGIGHLREDTKVLKAAIKYLKEST